MILMITQIWEGRESLEVKIQGYSSEPCNG